MLIRRKTSLEELLKIQNLSVEYRTGGAVAKAVNDISLTIHKGEAIGLVGESGAGKTTTALSILQLLPERVSYITGGDITYHGKSILKMKERELQELRGSKISMVFANPLTSLNPVFTVGEQVMMVLRKHSQLSNKDVRKRAEEIFRMVGIPEYRLDEYPHQFSGGLRQRVGIAAALVCSPELLILDEPTTALDVTIQAQILELIKSLQEEYSSALLMITHNLGIIAELCQKVAIMYAGEIVEFGTVQEVFGSPRHWYTVGLLNAIPKLEGVRKSLSPIKGYVANAQNLPDGCKFHPRCDNCAARCEKKRPPLMKLNENHYVACWEVGAEE